MGWPNFLIVPEDPELTLDLIDLYADFLLTFPKRIDSPKLRESIPVLRVEHTPKNGQT